MNTEIINLKVDAKTKKQAQKVAEGLGLTLSAILKAYLKQLISEKSVTFSIPEEELELSDFAIQQLEDSDADIKAGRVTSFYSVDDELLFLDKKISDNESKKTR